MIDTGRAGGATDSEVRSGVERLASLLRGDSEVADVVVAGPQTVDETGRYLHVQAIGKHEYGLPESQEFVERLRDVIIPAAAFPAETEVLAGGGPPFGVDFLDITYGAFPWLVLAVLLLTYVLLVRAFRSLLLPLKAIVLNLLSIAAAYGILVLAFKLGAGEPFGLTQFDQIEGWIPVFLFAMLFGLSMDYEVFLVSRMREEWDATRDNEAAIRQGLAKTGRLVTAAGLIMVAAFMGFVAGSIVGLQQFGLGLAAAILIDVTIIRALLVPSAMKLFGRWNWWLPEGAAKVFRVKPSPLEQPPAPALRPAGQVRASGAARSGSAGRRPRSRHPGQAQDSVGPLLARSGPCVRRVGVEGRRGLDGILVFALDHGDRLLVVDDVLVLLVAHARSLTRTIGDR